MENKMQDKETKDEDGEFDVLRIGFRYFRSKDADDYYSSIEAIGEEDFKDYESI